MYALFVLVVVTLSYVGGIRIRLRISLKCGSSINLRLSTVCAFLDHVFL